MPTPKISVRRIRLNRGGYTSSGRYYGVGAPLYEATYDPGGTMQEVQDTEFRAGDRASALRKAREHFGVRNRLEEKVHRSKLDAAVLEGRVVDFSGMKKEYRTTEYALKAVATAHANGIRASIATSR